MPDNNRSSLYPILASQFPNKNFDTVARVLETYFPDLFQLKLLNNLWQDSKDGSYVRFFQAVIKNLQAKHTEEEIIDEVYRSLLQDETVRKCFKEQYLVVPTEGSQVGFLEKIATGQLKVAEPLSFIDMLRITENLRYKYSEHDKRIKKIGVFNLSSMREDKVDLYKYKENTQALMINLNIKANQIPKWGVLNLSDPDNPELYCECGLTEDEKKQLQAVMKLDTIHYVNPRPTDNRQSTGYTAVAWLDNHVTKYWTFDLEADFNLLFKACVYVQFRSDNSLHTINHNIYDTDGKFFCNVFTQSLNKVKERNELIQRYNKANPGRNVSPTTLSNALYHLAGISMLGKLGDDDTLPLNHLNKTLEAFIGWDDELYFSLIEKTLRTNVVGFIDTLFKIKALIVDDQAQSVTLTIPDSINVNQIKEVYTQVAQEKSVFPTLLRSISKTSKKFDDLSQNDSNDMAESMILNLFRAYARKKTIQIDLPHHYPLSDEAIGLIVSWLQDNPFITRLVNTSNHRGLERICEQLKPIFARNRWLAECDYSPPITGDFWREVAKKWLGHLASPIAAKDASFKECVNDMGLEGLQALLALLEDDDAKPFVDTILDDKKPTFYASVPGGEEGQSFIDCLINHIESENAFPFSQLDIRIGRDNIENIKELIGVLNSSSNVKTIIFSDAINHLETLKNFLNIAQRIAKKAKWTIAIEIPKLTSGLIQGDELRALRYLLMGVNNVINQNAIDKHGKALAKSLKEKTSLSLDFDGQTGGSSSSSDSPSKPLVDDDLSDLFATAIDKMSSKQWPLTRTGSAQLQFQQQQQIQQQRQMQQQNIKRSSRSVEDLIIGERVTHETISRLLADDYDALVKSDKHLESLPLKDLFTQWISANPEVKASHIVSSMTQHAAKMLLMHHAHISSGLVLDNLPKGFFTQRASDESLVLCYDPELGFVNDPTPLTLHLSTEWMKKPKAWLGDFRLFCEMPDDGELSLEDALPAIALFSKLQPVLGNHEAEFEAFCEANPDVLALLGDNQKKIIANWVVFYQFFAFKGIEGVKYFIDLSEDKYQLTNQDVAQKLFEKQDEVLKKELSRCDFTDKQLSGFGQIYHQQGTEVLGVLLAKLVQIKHRLGDDLFKVICDDVLERCDDYTSFMTSSYMTTFDEMMEVLSTDKALCDNWSSILYSHMTAVGWDAITQLWQGYRYFTAQVQSLGLELKDNAFEGVAESNQLVIMDRILQTLNNIPNQDDKNHFITHLKDFNLSEGGLPYAFRHEHFHQLDTDLELHDFHQGTPTYAPDLATLNSWGEDKLTLSIKRALASAAKLDQKAYQILSNHFARLDCSSEDKKHQLIILLSTNYPLHKTRDICEQLKDLDSERLKQMASYLNKALFDEKNTEGDYSLTALLRFVTDYPDGIVYHCKTGTFLTVLSHLEKAGLSIHNFCSLLQTPIERPVNCSVAFFEEGYTLAVLFGVKDPNALKQFFDIVNGLSPIAKQELNVLIKQLLSINYEASRVALSDFQTENNWTHLLQCLADIGNNETEVRESRTALMTRFASQGIVFGYSASGDVRPLLESDLPAEMTFFVDHKERLNAFFTKHLFVPTGLNVGDALNPMISFLKQLQISPTYLNEIEPLLASLEQTKDGLGWTLPVFADLLQSLQPTDATDYFPIYLLDVIVKHPILAAKPIDDLDKSVPNNLKKIFQTIASNTLFNASQRAIWCELALTQYSWTKNTDALDDVIAALSDDSASLSRDAALAYLKKADNNDQLSTMILQIKAVLKANPSNQSASLWFKAAADDNKYGALLDKIIAADPTKGALLLEIIANSALQGDVSKQQINLTKLCDKLEQLPSGYLVRLAACYHGKPSPEAADIKRLLRNESALKSQEAWDESIESFLKNPHPQIRMDYAGLLASRENDLKRFFREMRLTKGETTDVASGKHSAKIALIFAQLKHLEAGTRHITGFDKPLHEMNKDELREAFVTLSRQYPSNDTSEAELWAILFHSIALTTRKYPHMAQQFALIAHDVCGGEASRVMKLATGEGKSHFVALRAAKLAGQGKKVDVCTAKRTLSERDQDDYAAFFDFLGLKSSYIDPSSGGTDYTDAHICYSTVGDLSLFLDKQSHQGEAIVVDKEKRVGLLDEFDFIQFDEGIKTEYNYARRGAYLPKKMTWFYQAINQFYLDNQNSLTDTKLLLKDTLNDAFNYLCHTAGKHKEKQAFLTSLARDPEQLIAWLQSAHQTAQLQQGVHFTVVKEELQVADSTYSMKEIIPLSSDNQKMRGSSFSGGVQQLLATRLNTEARAKGESQDYHVHAESKIISSQIASCRINELWSTWEGFSGTLSASQASALFKAHGTSVLQVPTNRLDRRIWANACFYQDERARFEAVLETLRQCLQEKKSLLFSCKDDAAVMALQAKLMDVLTDEEKKQFIFYTNEDKRLPSDILKKKSKKEKWNKHNEKEQGIALVASGFGRGDNVEVDAVILCDVLDDNDLVQKGGRTARNGAKGEVFQFYLNNDLIKEEQSLIQCVKLNDKIQRVLGDVDGHSDDEKRFARVLLLREYVAALQNSTNQYYRESVAHFSTWAMSRLDEYKKQSLSPENSLSLDALVIHALSQADKYWNSLGSDILLADKAEGLHDKLMHLSAHLSDKMKETGFYADISPFQLNNYQDLTIDMVAKKSLRLTSHQQLITSIASQLAGLPLGHINPDALKELPQQLEQLAEMGFGLILLNRKLKTIKSMDELPAMIEALMQGLANNPASAWIRRTPIMTFDEDGDDFFAGIDAHLTNLFYRHLDRDRSILTEVTNYLKKPGLLDKTARIERMVVIMEALNSFDEHLKHEYLVELDGLMEETTDTLKAILPPQQAVLPYNTFSERVLLAKRYQGNQTLADTYANINTVLSSHPISVLDQHEIFSKQLGENQSRYMGLVLAMMAHGRDEDIKPLEALIVSYLKGADDTDTLMKVCETLFNQPVSGYQSVIDQALMFDGEKSLSILQILTNRKTALMPDYLEASLGLGVEDRLVAWAFESNLSDDNAVRMIKILSSLSLNSHVFEGALRLFKEYSDLINSDLSITEALFAYLQNVGLKITESHVRWPLQFQQQHPEYKPQFNALLSQNYPALLNSLPATLEDFFTGSKYSIREMLNYLPKAPSSSEFGTVADVLKNNSDLIQNAKLLEGVDLDNYSALLGHMELLKPFIIQYPTLFAQVKSEIIGYVLTQPNYANLQLVIGSLLSMKDISRLSLPYVRHLIECFHLAIDTKTSIEDVIRFDRKVVTPCIGLSDDDKYAIEKRMLALSNESYTACLKQLISAKDIIQKYPNSLDIIISIFEREDHLDIKERITREILAWLSVHPTLTPNQITAFINIVSAYWQQGLRGHDFEQACKKTFALLSNKPYLLDYMHEFITTQSPLAELLLDVCEHLPKEFDKDNLKYLIGEIKRELQSNGLNGDKMNKLKQFIHQESFKTIVTSGFTNKRFEPLFYDILIAITNNRNPDDVISLNKIIVAKDDGLIDYCKAMQNKIHDLSNNKYEALFKPFLNASSALASYPRVFERMLDIYGLYCLVDCEIINESLLGWLQTDPKPSEKEVLRCLEMVSYFLGKRAISFESACKQAFAYHKAWSGIVTNDGLKNNIQGLLINSSSSSSAYQSSLTPKQLTDLLKELTALPASSLTVLTNHFPIWADIIVLAHTSPLLVKIFSKMVQKAGDKTLEYYDALVGKIRGNLSQSSEDELNHLLNRLDKVTLEEAEQLLSNKAVGYLFKDVAPLHHDSTTAMIHRFHNALSHNPDTAACLVNTEMAQNTNTRLLWMRALSKEAFMTSNNKQTDLVVQYHWDKARNQQALREGLNVYKDKAKSDLKPSNLVKLSHELEVVGEIRLEASSSLDTQQVREALKTLMSDYRSVSYKSKGRVQQMTNLFNKINQLCTQHKDSPNILYHEINQALLKHRGAIIASDATDNKTRFLALNRGGESRLLNTIHRMQHTLTRHWVNDINALPSFRHYKAAQEKSFNDLLNGFSHALTINNGPYRDKTYHGMRKLTRFFQSDESQKAHLALEGVLLTYSTLNHLKNDHEDLITAINKALPYLPGELKMLAQEVLNREKVFAELSYELPFDQSTMGLFQ